MVDSININIITDLAPILVRIARKICIYMADDLVQEGLTELIEMLQERESIPAGYAIRAAARSMRDYYIANRTPVYIPSRTMRDKAVKEYTKLLAALWMGAEHV